MRDSKSEDTRAVRGWSTKPRALHKGANVSLFDILLEEQTVLASHLSSRTGRSDWRAEY